MVKTAQEIIQKRKELWQDHHDIERDKEYTQAIAEYMLKDEAEPLRQEIKDNPELLIEMAFVVVDKEQNTVPFFLNGIQSNFIQDLKQAKKDFLECKRIHLNFLILKGRQGGFTSVITAYQLACTITQRNFSGFTLADSSDNTNTIFEDKAKFPYSNLPEQLKPTEKYNNRREFHFDKLNSRWRVSTAGNKEVGRSKTINFFHGSEAAFWDELMKILTGLGEALTKDSIKILETTANGYNEYKELWDGAIKGENNWEAKFYAWWLTPEYRLKFESEHVKNEFIQDIDCEEWIYKRCKWLREFVKLELEQIYWYFNKWKDLKENIKQEYPCSADEAFLASGRCVFDQETIIYRIEHLKKLYKERPPKRGRFTFEWNDPDTQDKIINESIKWVDDINGPITIYEDVQNGYPYVLGGDTKGEGHDFYSGTVLNNVTGNRAAVLHMQSTNSKPYTWQMYCLGMYFNKALIGIEINFNTAPIEELQRLNYPNQYMRQQYDKITKEIQKKYGWKTDGNTRPLIIDKEIDLIENNIELFNDLTMLNEALTFVYDESNRPDAQSGKHDDVLLSDMISNEIRTQQSFKVSEETQHNHKKLKDKLKPKPKLIM